ncbi:MAG TPA: hypothetical protein VF157_13440 [Chloroflexota bacterium]
MAAPLTADDSHYLTALAEAISQVSVAQNRLMVEVVTMSQTPAILQDAGWQARYDAAMEGLVQAANRLRVEPVPDTMRLVDATLARAQSEVRQAASGLDDVGHAAKPDSIVRSLRHLDRMAQLLQQARARVPTG